MTDLSLQSAPRIRYDPQAVLNFIICFKREHDGCSPTYREIQRGCSISSTSVVRVILDKLELQGAIKLGGTRLWTRIEITGGQWTWINDKETSPHPTLATAESNV